MDRRKKVNMSKLSDDELLDFMDSVESDEDFSSDDSLLDPDFNPDAITTLQQNAIDEYVEQLENRGEEYYISHAVNVSLNISSDDIPSASSTMNPIEEIAAEEIVETQAVASTSAATQPSKSFFKTPKRPRSPLPAAESSGPTVVPSACGFTGAGKINHI